MGSPIVLPDLMRTMNSASTDCVEILLFPVAMANVYQKIYNVIVILTAMIKVMNLTVAKVQSISIQILNTIYL